MSAAFHLFHMPAAGLCLELAIPWLAPAGSTEKIPKSNELSGTGLAALTA
jgi:hypothetical protein